MTDEQLAAQQNAADTPANNSPQYVNDLSDADKQAIVKYVNENVQEILAQPNLSTNNLCHIAQVSHGSIKSRGKTTTSAREIVMGVINGTRATRQSVNEVSVSSFLDSLSEEEQNKILAKYIRK
jgi:hypothetical protein